jgi:hypothetical protein
MTPPAAPERSTNHRVPGERIRHRGWRSARVPLRSRDVPALLLARGIDVTHAALRQWGLPCGQDSAHLRKRRCAQPGDTWHLEAVCLPRQGQRHAWGRAVDHDDHVRDILGQRRRHTHAAQAVLSHGAQGGTGRATGDHHGSAQARRRRAAGALAGWRTSAAALPQEPRRTRAAADAAARVSQPGVYVGGAGAVFCVRRRPSRLRAWGGNTGDGAGDRAWTADRSGGPTWLLRDSAATP